MISVYSRYEDHPSPVELEDALKKLQEDTDRDVRYFCSPEAYQETTYANDTSSLSEY